MRAQLAPGVRAATMRACSTSVASVCRGAAEWSRPCYRDPVRLQAVALGCRSCLCILLRVYCLVMLVSMLGYCPGLRLALPKLASRGCRVSAVFRTHACSFTSLLCAFAMELVRVPRACCGGLLCAPFGVSKHEDGKRRLSVCVSQGRLGDFCAGETTGDIFGLGRA